MNSSFKILGWESFQLWRASQRAAGRRVAVTNGCFDLLHSGHVEYLEAARATADCLVIGLNGDTSVRTLKGPNRPVQPQADRARVLAALACVDAVTVFEDVRAHRFLEIAQPDVYVKGGDYSLETLDPGERTVLESVGSEFVFLPYRQGKSTTELIAKLRRL